MKHETTRKNAKKYLRAIDENIMVLKKQYDSIANHDMRVAFKKLRTLLRIDNRLADVKNKKPFMSFKMIYDAAGELRDQQIYEEAVSKYMQGPVVDNANPNNAFTLHLEHGLNVALGEFDANKFYALINGVMVPQIRQQEIRRFIDKQYAAIAEISDDLLNYDALHKVRKHYKNILYSIPYLHVREKNKQYIGCRKMLEVITVELGDYIDTCTKLMRSKHQLANIDAFELRTILERVQTDWLIEKHKQKEHIVKQLLKENKF